MRSICVFLLGTAVLLLSVPTTATTLSGSDYATWGILSSQAVIPAGSVITEAELTLYGVSHSNNIFSVYLLDNPRPDYFAAQKFGGDSVFAGYAARLAGTMQDGNFVCRLGQSGNNDSQSFVWNSFAYPFNFQLADGRTVSYTSSLLELMDYIGTGGSFGIGIEANSNTSISFSSIELKLTVSSYLSSSADQILTFSYSPAPESSDGDTGPTILTYEAETASLGGGTAVSSAVDGFTGTGFVDYVSAAGESVEWTINVPTEGLYKLEFRYALGTGNRPLRIDVNAAVANASLAFPATGGWTTWSTVSMTTPLNAGSNTVRATSIGSSGGNVDSLSVIPVFVDVLEAEAAVLGNGAVASSVIAGFTGNGFVDYVGSSGEFTEWTVNVPAAGQYELRFGYALGAGNRPLRIDVNGATANASLAFPATGSWTAWSTVSMRVTFAAGANTVRATSIGSSGGNVDQLFVIGQ